MNIRNIDGSQSFGAIYRVKVNKELFPKNKNIMEVKDLFINSLKEVYPDAYPGCF